MRLLRRLAIPIGVLAAVLLAYLVNPWLQPEGSLRQLVTYSFWVLSVLLVVALFEDRKQAGAQEVEIDGPAFTRFLFHNSRAGLFWLPIRLFVGFAWLDAGIHKLFPAGKPMGAGWLDGGASLRAYWERAAAIPEAPARPAISFEWYRDFLNFLLASDAQSWFAYLIVFGEIAIGVGLLVGALTGIAAFFGATMNMSFLLAGSASTNPVLFALAIGLILGWRVCGYYGVDRYLLPMLGTPWSRGPLLRFTAAKPIPG